MHHKYYPTVDPTTAPKQVKIIWETKCVVNGADLKMIKKDMHIPELNRMGAGLKKTYGRAPVRRVLMLVMFQAPGSSSIQLCRPTTKFCFSCWFFQLCVFIMAFELVSHAAMVGLDHNSIDTFCSLHIWVNIVLLTLRLTKAGFLLK